MSRPIPRSELLADPEEFEGIPELLDEVQLYAQSYFQNAKVHVPGYRCGYKHAALIAIEVSRRVQKLKRYCVVCGDIPWAIIEDNGQSNQEFLEFYIATIREWLMNPHQNTVPGLNVPVCYRGNLQPIPLNPVLLEMLSSRLDFIEKNLADISQ